MSASIEAAVTEYIKDEILAHSGRQEPDLDEETSLFRKGIIDSFGLFTLASFLEERFSISVGDEDLVPENFDTIAKIAAFVSLRQGATRVEKP
jgi:acyl carrier protein